MSEQSTEMRQTNVKLSVADREWLRTRAAAEMRTASGQIRFLIDSDRKLHTGNGNGNGRHTR